MVELAEAPKLIVSAQDRILIRRVSAEEDDLYGNHSWEISKPVPGLRIIKSLVVYHGITLLLVVTEGGHHCIFRTIDNKTFNLVHDHENENEILGLHFIDLGHALFSAADGWWATQDAGVSWYELSWHELGVSDWDEDPDLGVIVPEYDTEVPEFEFWWDVLGVAKPARSASIVQLRDGAWTVIAYATDRQIYCADYPDGNFTSVYDAANSTEKWYPAIAGGPVGVLAGAGNRLLRSTQGGREDTWEVVQEVSGTIKNIVMSEAERTPIFLIEVEGPDGETSSLYRTDDLGDSLTQYIDRMQMITSVQTVYATGTNVVHPMFAMSGRRAADGPITTKILEVV